MEKNEIRRKLLLKPLDWVTLLPFAIGATIGLGAWAVHYESGVAVAASVIPILISSGIYLNRLLFGWGDNYKRIVNEWRESVEKDRNAKLDRLYLNLQKDGDPRTETLLKDLRTLTKALMGEQSESLAINAFDIVTDVDKLFQRCVDYLTESLDLWKTASEMERESIKKQLLSHREILILEVEKSLENLGEVLSSIKKASVNSGDRAHLAELRNELTTRLRLAEQVEEKVNALRRKNSSEDDDKYLQYAE